MTCTYLFASILAAAGPLEWRQPVGLALSPDGKCLFVANRATGSIAVVDVSSWTLSAERGGFGRLEAVAFVGDHIVAADADGDLLHVLGWSGGSLRHRRAVAAARAPMQLASSPAAETVYASCRVARRVEAFDVASGRKLWSTELDFPPHCLLVSESGQRLFVGDAYRGRIAALDVASGRPLRSFSFPGTNIRGMALERGGDRFVFTHQILSEKSIISRDAVFWGAYLTNNLRTVVAASFLDPAKDPLDDGSLRFLGDARFGAGDPAGVAILEGATVVCLAGVDEVGVLDGRSQMMNRIPVGRRPTAIVPAADRLTVFVACTHGNSIVRVDPFAGKVIATLSLGPSHALTSAQRGEVLFHDARLSLDGWYSCHSCHTDGGTNGSSADTMGDGNDGAPKSTPSLEGVTKTGPWSWTGRFHSLADQIESSVVHSMQGSPPSKERVGDLQAYLATLEPQRPAGGPAEPIERGRQVFQFLGCDRCHRPPTYTTPATYDVGLDDGLAGHDRFNPPSLIGVSSSAPYLHDGRASSLEEVFREHRHQVDESLSPRDLADLLAFLESL